MALLQKRYIIQKYWKSGFLFFDVFSCSVLSQTWASIFRYIYIITVILRPSCWRYGGGSFTQKDEKSKNRVYVFFCFAIFWALRFSLYRYIYIITVILRPTCWRYRGGSSTKKIRKSKIRVHLFLLLCYILSHSVILQPRTSLYICIHK